MKSTGRPLSPLGGQIAFNGHGAALVNPPALSPRSPAPRSPVWPNVPKAQSLPPSSAAGAVIGRVFDVRDSVLVMVVLSPAVGRPGGDLQEDNCERQQADRGGFEQKAL